MCTISVRARRHQTAVVPLPKLPRTVHFEIGT